MVTAIVAAPGPFASPSSAINSTVAIEEHRMFTTLFPTKMVDNRSSYLSSMFSTSFALLLPCSAILLIRTLFSEENDISLAEKNAEITIQPIMIIIVEFIAYSPFCLLLL